MSLCNCGTIQDNTWKSLSKMLTFTVTTVSNGIFSLQQALVDVVDIDAHKHGCHLHKNETLFLCVFQ